MYALDICSDIVHVDIAWDDGAPIEALAFFIRATAQDGSCLRHFFCPLNVRRVFDEDGLPHWPRRPDGEVETAMERLKHRIEDHLANGGVLDPDLWDETYPRYGSSAYERDEASGLHKQWERLADEEDGFPDRVYARAA